jgi:hypothetical protein
VRLKTAPRIFFSAFDRNSPECAYFRPAVDNRGLRVINEFDPNSITVVKLL